MESMIPRLLQPSDSKSFFLFGPRGTGKTAWVRATFEDAVYLDLLESDLYTRLLAAPNRLESFVPPGGEHRVVIDEVQRIPALLDEVHRLIETRRLRFVLTGSSARKLKREGTNLLAGRALTDFMHPFTATELGDGFRFDHALRFGCLPAVWMEKEPERFLSSYVTTYLKEEVQQEGLTRNLGAFSRFLEAASFSQGAVLNITEVARECSVERKVVSNYFTILEDLLLAIRLPVFSRKARRKLVAHPKFFFFDVGVYRAIRPAGPLESIGEVEGPALETLVLQQLRALNDVLHLGYAISYWRTPSGTEVDFVLCGKRGLKAIEVKRSDRLRPRDLTGLRAFQEDYPVAECLLLHGGDRDQQEGSISVWPIESGLLRLHDWLREWAPTLPGVRSAVQPPSPAYRERRSMRRSRSWSLRRRDWMTGVAPHRRR
ncbi:MAG: ATP-binding protein [Planctomycetota bacterium]